MRGDIVLVKSQGLWYQRIIEWATHGPYVHCEIDLGDGKFIGAHDAGITIIGSATGPRYVYVTTSLNLDDIEAGLRWAMMHEGDRYGWSDIFDDANKVLGVPVYLGIDHWMDCSDFVTRYLIAAKCAGPLGALADHPETVTPNDLARVYKLL